MLLHGIGRSLEDWAPQYERLASAYRVIALDIPGFGFSGGHANRSHFQRSRAASPRLSMPSANNGSYT